MQRLPLKALQSRPRCAEKSGLVILAYGNPSRGDDALGPELMQCMENQMQYHAHWHNIKWVLDFQLQIEHTQDLKDTELALFIDASITAPRPYSFQKITAKRDDSYTSHALSPAALLHVFEKAYRRPAPAAFLLSIRGEEFILGRPLSKQAQNHLNAAIAFTQRLCDQPDSVKWSKWVEVLPN